MDTKDTKEGNLFCLGVLRVLRVDSARLRRMAVLFAFAAVTPAAAQQTFTGKISDSMCGASHLAGAAAGPSTSLGAGASTSLGTGPSTSLGTGGLTDRQCLLACIKALAKY